MMDKPESTQGRLRICIVSDAWHPQVNGVVRTLDSLRGELKRSGHKVFMLTPKLFKTTACPTYPEIRLSLNTPLRVSAFLRRFRPDAIHIATEGPLGWATRRWCVRNNIAFTTAYHTAFPEYIAARTGIPARLFYPMFRHFHAPSTGVLVATETVSNMLKAHGFTNIRPWTRGVDTSLFQPNHTTDTPHQTSEPVLLYVGRVAVEKNIEAFLKCKTRGRKIVVGDGPALTRLKTDYPEVDFLGARFGKELATLYASADVFVFPSKTDTFGLVMIEALAAGTPVAAYPVQGPLDVVGPEGHGPGTGAFTGWSKPIAALNNDLATAIEQALSINRSDCCDYAQLYNWKTVAQQFISALKVNETLPAAA
jgi:glycosyltransferase involved in cell wall biosynthesis